MCNLILRYIYIYIYIYRLFHFKVCLSTEPDFIDMVSNDEAMTAVWLTGKERSHDEFNVSVQHFPEATKENCENP